MAEPDKRPVTLEELVVSSLAQTDALAKPPRAITGHLVNSIYGKGEKAQNQKAY
jgi:hypothetical protein